ncbi:hypothetical protein PFISCL1PPCAC_15513, partial [Pristionchus fissidentatus]
MNVPDDEKVELILVAECSTPSKAFTYMWKNCLFHFGGGLCSAVFQEDFKRIMVHDWTGTMED